ncbi:antiterminator Q family protein [Pantoea agglomerans]|uniref:antiterminator Q family protein n=1 Tax=Enterobacter agglomerans TaxID=549 RepID=UPI00320B4AA8
MRDMSQVLERWAGWAKSDSSGVDYSSIAAGFKGLLSQDSKLTLTCSDNDGLIIEGCLARLKEKRPDEHAIIVLHYFFNISKRNLAKKAKRDEKIVRIEIQMAEGFIEGCLAMIDVRLDMDAELTPKKILKKPLTRSAFSLVI